MRVLVTGGAGFIGSCYVRMALSGELEAVEPTRITVYDKMTYAANLANLDPVSADRRLDVVEGDICDATALDDVLPGHDLVVNFAAETHVDRSITGPQDFAVTNMLGVQVLLDACLRHEIPRVVHIGTDEVYGSIDEGAWVETDPLLPNSPYSAAKAGGELLVRAYFQTYGLNVSSTRCSNNYGPYQYPEKVIPLFLTNLMMGRKVPLYGDGLNVRDWLHVTDHCAGIQVVAERGAPGEAYNIGGGTELTNRELTSRLLDAMGVGWEMVEYVTDRKGHDRRYALDDTRLRALGYQPRIDFESGLAATIAWYRENEEWWRPLLAGSEPVPTAGI
jgi:dTDP-glucose 4,6-dehydratase